MGTTNCTLFAAHFEMAFQQRDIQYDTISNNISFSLFQFTRPPVEACPPYSTTSHHEQRQNCYRYSPLCPQHSAKIPPSPSAVHIVRTHDDGGVQRPDWPPESVRRPSGQ